MTTPTDIDRKAPVVAHHEIDIAASLEPVWQLHVDVDAWPTWMEEVSSARLDGAFAPGSSFTWTSYGARVASARLSSYPCGDRQRQAACRLRRGSR